MVDTTLMRTWLCHKQVSAERILSVLNDNESSGSILELGKDRESTRFDVKVTEEWMAKHKPEAGGYFVVYADGYTSYSPAAPFEEGYSVVSAGVQNSEPGQQNEPVTPEPQPEPAPDTGEQEPQADAGVQN